MAARRALISVSDKRGVADFARELVERGWEVVSTGGTARMLEEQGVPVTPISQVTGHPEIMDGRVKTLHPSIHGPLLARREVEADLEALERLGYSEIDLVAVNLYPFQETVRAGGVSVDEAMEQVDIGGPTMIRAAAKNHRSVWVVVDPADYSRVLESLDGGGTEGGSLRLELAAKVFRHISRYDEAVAEFLSGPGNEEGPLPPEISLRLERIRPLRYGENPDQQAAFYRERDAPEAGVGGLVQLQGKDLSYNNILDLDGALLSVSPFAFSHRPAVTIIKHTTPAGVAVGETLEEAYRKALRTDPVSAFGSVIATNRPVDGPTAEAIAELFVECIVAPGFRKEARTVLGAKKNLRLLVFPEAPVPRPTVPVTGDVMDWLQRDGAFEELRNAAHFMAAHGRHPHRRVLREVYGGILAQEPPCPPFYRLGIPQEDWEVVTSRAPTDQEWDDLRFAWAAVFGVKSNAILMARDGATLGIGAGQMSRVDASRLAVQKAADQELSLEGAALASDAFFPFRDGVDAAARAGVGCIVQPGGSVRDSEVVEAADEAGLAMIFTGRRLFRH